MLASALTRSTACQPLHTRQSIKDLFTEETEKYLRRYWPERFGTGQDLAVIAVVSPRLLPRRMRMRGKEMEVEVELAQGIL
jgi:hypothetical protein